MPAVHFSTETRAALSGALRRSKPRPSVEQLRALLGALEEGAAICGLLHVDRSPERIRTLVLDARQRVLDLRAIPSVLQLEADDVLSAALSRQRLSPDLPKRLDEALGWLVDALAAAALRPRAKHRPAGAGRVPGVAPELTSWFAGHVASILDAHDVRATGHRDGVLADVLRALWPAVFGQELPGELQHVLRRAIRSEKAGAKSPPLQM